MQKNRYIIGALLSMGVAVNAVQAAEFAPASVRALGMGGSSVASTNGVDASYWNPAAYGFFAENAGENDNNDMSGKDFGLDVDIGAGGYIFGPIEANRLKIQNLPDPSALTNVGTLSSSQIQDAAKIVDGLSSLDTSPMGANVFANATIGTRVSNYGLGIRQTVDLNSSIAIDATNVGFANVFTSFTAPGALLPATIAPGTINYFSQAQADGMATNLVNSGAVNSIGEANAVVIAYDAALVTSGAPVAEQQTNADAMTTIANAAGTDLTNNTTSLSLRGVAIREVGFTYGYAINEELSVGGVLKYMQADIVASDTKLFAQNAGVSFDRNNVESSSAFGLDLGVMYRIPSWQVGLTIRNLNTPKFEHSGAGTFANTPYTYQLKPQAKFGVAWIPTDTVTVEAALDLTKNKGAVASGESQYWNVGLEWDAWKVLALRAGAFQNMAQTDIGLVPTFGLGLNLWAARIDLAVAVSSKKVAFDGREVPAYAAGALALAVDF